MDKKFGKHGFARPSRSGKQRKFRGNQHTSESDTSYTSTSATKLKNSDDFDVSVDPSVNYCFINFVLIFSGLQQLLVCKECNGEVNFTKYGQRGLGFKLRVKCSCNETFINSCSMINNSYEVNRRFVFVMRMLGIGIHGIKNFCGLMDLSQGFNNKSYYDIIENIKIAVKTVVDIVMKKAVNEEKVLNAQAGNKEDHLTVSGDGSWAKRGFTSLVGIVSLIGKYSNKIVDVIVKCSRCKACEMWKGKTDTVEYESWYEDHEEVCDANHHGSAGKMEVDGVIEMFQRSEELYKVKYSRYIGDGDTKTFKALLDVNPYGDDCIVQKKECILHVKKRMYRNIKEGKKKLTQLKKAGKKVEDQKANKPKATKAKKVKPPIKKRKIEPVKTAKLTTKLMADLSLYYGLAIRRHPDSVEDMKKEIWATYFHKISTDEHPQHQYCPPGSESWCKWQKAQVSGEEYEHPPALDTDAQEILRPIYEDLSRDDLLERCLGSNTQNNNESFNSCVWQLAPKHIFSGKKIVEIATCCAACTFNEGFKSILKILDVMGVTIGPHAQELAERQDTARIARADRSASEQSKEGRLTRMMKKIAENEAWEEAEGVLYGAGIAD